MKHWYVNENALMSGPFGRSLGVVYVPDEDDVEKVAKALWDRDERAFANDSYGRFLPTPWAEAHELDHQEYRDEAREAMRILGILG